MTASTTEFDVPAPADRIDTFQAAIYLGKSRRTLWRYVAVGYLGRVRLRTIRVGRRVITCQQWLDEFIAATQTLPSDPGEPLTTSGAAAVAT
ncbi:MAG TPA: hypothetical protein VG826_21430 [Pirellulales bacterium]|nr:hypothetical protein [Pirellulales bacterium]